MNAQTVLAPKLLARLSKLSVLASIVCLASCDMIADHALDCINNDRPQFNREELPVAILNQEYLTSIKASIENNAFDESYLYSFFLFGELPSGLSYETEWDSPEFTILGTPTELGRFPFTLRVIAEDRYRGFDDGDDDIYDDGDSLCDDKHLQQFVLTVVMEE